MFGSGAEIEIKLTDEDTRKWVDVKNEEGASDRQPLYYDGETVAGNVKVNMKAGKKVEHQGIRIEFVGQIGEFNKMAASPSIYGGVASPLNVCQLQ